MGLCVGMNTVVLKQIRFHWSVIGNACQQERHHWDVLGLGNAAEEPPKPLGIRGTKVWWNHHPGQYRLGARLPDSHHHRLEIVFGCLQRESPECIIGAQLDQNPARTDAGQNSRKSTASTGGCFTADAGIDDLNLATTLLQAALEQRDPPTTAHQTIFGGQAVSKHQQDLWGGRERREPAQAKTGRQRQELRDE